MIEFLVTVQLKTSYTIPILARDAEEAAVSALEHDPPRIQSQESERTATKVLRLTQTSEGLRYVADPLP